MSASPTPAGVPPSPTGPSLAPGDSRGRRPRAAPSSLAAVAVVVVALGVVLRLVPVADDPLHPDECLYATWALSVADGSDPLLRRADVDKPPVYPYLLAGWSMLVGSGATALRLLGVVAAAVAMLAMYRLAAQECDRSSSLAALVLLALSPVDVALDAGALTDPPAIAFALLSALAAANGRSLIAGALVGLAVGTKPQVLAYLPLAFMLLPLPRRRSWTRAAAGMAAVLLSVVAWEIARAAPATFVASAARNYGLLAWNPPSQSLAVEWLSLLRWVWGEPWAVALWAGALVSGAVSSCRCGGTRRGQAVGIGALAGLMLYVGGSVAATMPAWDRYALAAVPLAALLLAWSAGALGRALRVGTLPGTVLSLALAALLWAPAREAAMGRLPLGDTSQWEGIEAVAEYVRGQVPGRATIVYRDLGWSVGYYMYGFPQDFVWAADDTSVVDTVERAEPCYVLSSTSDAGREMVAALSAAGVPLSPVHTSYGHAGRASMSLYLVARRQ